MCMRLQVCDGGVLGGMGVSSSLLGSGGGLVCTLRHGDAWCTPCDEGRSSQVTRQQAWSQQTWKHLGLGALSRSTDSNLCSSSNCPYISMECPGSLSPFTVRSCPRWAVSPFFRGRVAVDLTVTLQRATRPRDGTFPWCATKAEATVSTTSRT